MKRALYIMTVVLASSSLVGILAFRAGLRSDYYSGNNYLLEVDPKRLDVDSIEIRNNATGQVMAIISRGNLAKIEFDTHEVPELKIAYMKGGDIIDVGTTPTMSGFSMRIDELSQGRCYLKALSTNYF